MAEQVELIDLKRVHPNPLNPRFEFDISGLKELADSIKQVGLVEPLVVRLKDDKYEVVVGERRYRAAKLAGLEQIPAIIRDYTDNEVIELNLIENVHREDLSAVEKGNCCKQLMKEYPEKYPTREVLGKKIGVSSNTITSWLQLVEAPKEIQKLIAPAEKVGVPRQIGKIDYDTALSITRKIESPERQIEVAREIAERPIYRRVAREIIKEAAEKPEKPIEKVIKDIVEAPFELPFRLNHMNPILNGTKTQTSRKGIPDPKIKEGAIIHAAVWEPHFADLRITSIERKRLGDFTEEDAYREGGYTLEEFRQVWKGLHDRWDDNEVVYVIHFERIK